MGLLEGRVVLVTGGGRGLGRGHCLELARHGATVVVNDVAGIGALIERIVEQCGGLDAVVNNAGILRDRMLTSMSEDEFDAVIAMHLKGTWT